MQYILNEKEYAVLSQKKSDNEIIALQNFCTLAANYIPVKVRWSKDQKPWGCILNPEEDRSDNTFSGAGAYCDECPARVICPYPYKEFSK